ncbi:diguanylate cyclase domain-containing protein [Spartinivicinus ruber]|uniref:diguanylate cyclase domain-containing protein n=1 Tax=Spartinivicinus ruber TaxID=2683272 RepID=UPI0013D758DA|nr:diguanylate cyclase [Spartinivicinus ruber]
MAILSDKVAEFNVLSKPGRILIVDDEPINIRVIHQVFSKYHTVFMATSGMQAINFLQKNSVDLILLDVVMPEMNGLTVCQQLKSSKETADIPVIFVTGHNSPEEEDACWYAGCVDFIHKPFNIHTLIHRVRSHLQLKFQTDLLKELAFFDGLTGVANRRYFNEHLRHEWRRCARNSKPLSLILLDIDHFKAFNDTYGHQYGDECLQKVASTIIKIPQRAGDLVARYGGEEFTITLPETALSGAVNVAKGIEASIRDLKIQHKSSTTAHVVTVSAGVATWVPDNDISPKLLIEQADRLLYQAKAQGRGQVCFTNIQKGNEMKAPKTLK